MRFTTATLPSSRRLALGLGTAALLGLLAACGGGGGSSGDSALNWGESSGSNAVTALKTTDTLLGSGALAANGKKLTVHYTGWLYDVRVANQKGPQFDSSVGKAPLNFTLGAGQVIKGWDQGFAGMKVGGKRTLLVPAALAYGASGAGGSLIPANAALIFEVELLGVE